jgi:hypothetical protein
MFNSANDLAQAALDLLEIAVTEATQGNQKLSAQLELAAVMLATHVCDWHFRPAEPTNADKQAFAAQYPEWDTLRAIGNGTKHPAGKYPRVDAAVQRRSDFWKDVDAWGAPMAADTLYVEVDGVQRSLHSLTWNFCRRYLGIV